MGQRNDLSFEELESIEQGLLRDGYRCTDWFEELAPGEYAKSSYTGGKYSFGEEVFFNIKWREH